MIPEKPPAKKVTGILTQVNHARHGAESVVVVFGLHGSNHVKLEFAYEMAVEVEQFLKRANAQVRHSRQIREERASWSTQTVKG